MDTTTKTIAITGASGGIGKATALELARLGHRVIMLVRDSDKSRAALDEVKAASQTGEVAAFWVDLASQESIRTAVGEITAAYPHIDVLINNAGVYKRAYESSPDGVEMTLAVNYLAPCLLTTLLLPLIERSSAGRIVNVTSEHYKKAKTDLEAVFGADKFKGADAYATSKLLIAGWTGELADELTPSGVTVNCVHPGVVATDAFREYPAWLTRLMNVFLSSPQDGAKASVYLATSPEVAETTGRYFYKTDKVQPISAPEESEALHRRAREIRAAVTR